MCWNLFLASLCFLSAQLYAAGQTATVTIIYSVNSVSAICISSNPGPLVVQTAVAGQGFLCDTDSSTTYALTTNNHCMRITGALSWAMPPGITLSAYLEAPRGATTAGPIPLDTAQSDLVTGITQVTQGGLSIIYTLSATEEATPVTGALNTITYTIGP